MVESTCCQQKSRKTCLWQKTFLRFFKHFFSSFLAKGPVFLTFLNSSSSNKNGYPTGMVGAAVTDTAEAPYTIIQTIINGS